MIKRGARLDRSDRIAMTQVLAIDDGTTGVRAMIFDERGACIAGAYGRSSRSIHDPVGSSRTHSTSGSRRRHVVGAALREAGSAPSSIAAVGVATQRSTTIVWERKSGRPVYPAIVWQDRRTAERAAAVLEQGLFTNSMASATKIEWILANSERGFERAAAGELCFGTVDTWLVWNLSGRRAHVTDHSNASCTTLYDVMNGGWDRGLLAILRLPEALLADHRRLERPAPKRTRRSSAPRSPSPASPATSRRRCSPS